ncbi:MAG: TdeIII family type II restriction endonuclease [Flavobacteriales bacterium]
MPVKVFLAFPYNPYHPEPYSRFTESGMMDAPNDFLVGDEYWDFLGGEGTFTELLETFDEVGIKSLKRDWMKNLKKLRKTSLISIKKLK